MTNSTVATPAGQPDLFGPMLRAWRRRRGTSQLALALQSGVSQRHVSFLESGRAASAAAAAGPRGATPPRGAAPRPPPGSARAAPPPSLPAPTLAAPPPA